MVERWLSGDLGASSRVARGYLRGFKGNRSREILKSVVNNSLKDISHFADTIKIHSRGVTQSNDW